ncbi:MAG: helix-turn-helix domain-containing protein [Sphingobacteriaceae bacterium]
MRNKLEKKLYHCKVEPFNFNELPEVIRQLFEKVEGIEKILAKLEPKEDDKNELLHVEEAAEFLKVSIAALYTKVSRQEIPFSKPGKRLYFNRSDLKDWITQSKRKTLREIRQDEDLHPAHRSSRRILK